MSCRMTEIGILMMSRKEQFGKELVGKRGMAFS